MKITAVVTCNQFGGMGQGNSLPWPELYFGRDNFEFFVGNNPVLLGKKSFQSLSNIKHIPDKNIVVYTQSASDVSPDYKTVSGLPETALSQLNLDDGEELFIAGGAEVFRIFYDHIDEWIITILEDHQLIFDKMIPLATIQKDFPVTTDVTRGQDNNQFFRVVKYSKQ